ncbi:MAG: SLATT domain-containing protein [Chloroflexi bacterium]|nr:SLATT domain-containing protein [Chloroflexota bacterium]
MSDAPPPASTSIHTKGDLEFLFKLYLNKRVESQMNFYTTRIRENELNSDFTFTASTFVMTLSSLLATISASDPAGSLRALVIWSAILSALAAMLEGFRQLYNWDRQLAIYRDAKLGLERAALIIPDNDLLDQSDIGAVYPRMIASTELVLTNEVNQWGQFLLDKEKQNEQPVERIQTIGTEEQRERIMTDSYGPQAEQSVTQETAAVNAASAPPTDASSNGTVPSEASTEKDETPPAAG